MTGGPERPFQLPCGAARVRGRSYPRRPVGCRTPRWRWPQRRTARVRSSSARESSLSPPDGPTMATVSPSRMCTLTPSRVGRPPSRLPTFRMVIMAPSCARAAERGGTAGSSSQIEGGAGEPGTSQLRRSTAAIVMRFVNSTTVMTLTREESLSNATKSFVIDGSAMRNDCGRST